MGKRKTTTENKIKEQPRKEQSSDEINIGLEIKRWVVVRESMNLSDEELMKSVLDLLEDRRVCPHGCYLKNTPPSHLTKTTPKLVRTVGIQVNMRNTRKISGTQTDLTLKDLDGISCLNEEVTNTKSNSEGHQSEKSTEHSAGKETDSFTFINKDVRWKSLKMCHGLKTDNELLGVLMDWYMNTQPAAQQTKDMSSTNTFPQALKESTPEPHCSYFTEELIVIPPANFVSTPEPHTPAQEQAIKNLCLLSKWPYTKFGHSKEQADTVSRQDHKASQASILRESAVQPQSAAPPQCAAQPQSAVQPQSAAQPQCAVRPQSATQPQFAAQPQSIFSLTEPIMSSGELSSGELTQPPTKDDGTVTANIQGDSAGFDNINTRPGETSVVGSAGVLYESSSAALNINTRPGETSVVSSAGALYESSSAALVSNTVESNLINSSTLSESASQDTHDIYNIIPIDQQLDELRDDKTNMYTSLESHLTHQLAQQRLPQMHYVLPNTVPLETIGLLPKPTSSFIDSTSGFNNTQVEYHPYRMKPIKSETAHNQKYKRIRLTPQNRAMSIPGNVDQESYNNSTNKEQYGEVHNEISYPYL